MNRQCIVYVRFVEGTIGLAPLPACEDEGGTVTLLASAEFDPDDTSTLFEFIPGDEVRTEPFDRPTRKEQSWSRVAAVHCCTAAP